MQRLLYLMSITGLIISINSGFLSGGYHQNILLRNVINLLMLTLSYRLIRIESVGAGREEGVGNVISPGVLQNVISMKGRVMASIISSAQ